MVVVAEGEVPSSLVAVVLVVDSMTTVDIATDIAEVLGWVLD